MDAITSSSSPSVNLVSLVQGKNASKENEKSIEGLPAKIMERLLEEINKNEKANDVELSYPINLHNIGLAFVPDALIHSDLEKGSYTPSEIYNELINIWIKNKNLSPALLYSVLDFFVREKSLDLKEALTLPADTAERTQPIQFTSFIAPSLIEEMHSKTFRESCTAPLLEKPFFDADYVSKLEARIQELPEEDVGNFVIKRIEKKPDILRSPECFRILLQNNLSHILDDQIGIILIALAKNMRYLESETLQSGALDSLKEKLSDFTGTEFGDILHSLLLNNCFLKSDALKLRVCNLCAKNLKRVLEKEDVVNHLTSQQLSLILIGFTNILIDKRSYPFPQKKIEPNILELFQIAIPYLSNEELPIVLKLWLRASGSFSNAPVFSLIEGSIDQLPPSKRIFILQWVAQNLPDAHQAYAPSMLTFIERKINNISEIPKWNTLGLLAKSLPSLDEKTKLHAIKLLQKHMTKGKDFSFLQRATNAFYKFAANFYPLNFNKVIAFFLAPLKMVRAFFANMSKLV